MKASSSSTRLSARHSTTRAKGILARPSGDREPGSSRVASPPTSSSTLPSTLPEASTASVSRTR